MVKKNRVNQGARVAWPARRVAMCWPRRLKPIDQKDAKAPSKSRGMPPEPRLEAVA